jgi:hypothetical protein
MNRSRRRSLNTETSGPGFSLRGSGLELGPRLGTIRFRRVEQVQPASILAIIFCSTKSGALVDIGIHI